MSSYKNFKIKLKQYSTYEDIVARKLIIKYNLLSEYIKCETNEYDIKLSNNITYELKCDIMGSKTGNCFIEYLGYGKPSGIAITKAKFYILSFDTISYYLIKVDELKTLIKDNNYRIVQTKDKSTSGFLIPISAIILHSELI